MAKSLDFNSLQRPTLEITMCDKKKTRLRLVCPTQALIEKLEAAGPELTEILQNNDAGAIRAVFSLAADLISCNDTRTKVTAEDLKEKYNLGFDAMVVFFSTYLDFINEEIKSAKN